MDACGWAGTSRDTRKYRKFNEIIAYVTDDDDENDDDEDDSDA